jgi:3-deoxy-D-manno-octulosonate 8-phosphate phosphatase (KDO 8-P phosphatase)
LDIQLLIIDVDGTLTDSSVYYGDGNVELKAFNTKDGLMLKALTHLGIDVIFLTGRESEIVTRRADDLGATAIQGISDKEKKLRGLLSEYGITFEQTAYIGDDLNDYTAMMMCGFKACPADAVAEIKMIADYVSHIPGGAGAVRDICEYLLRKHGKYDDFLNLFGVQLND